MRTPRRGEVYRLKSDQVGKARPILVVSITSLNSGTTCSAIPFTTQKLFERRRLPSCVSFNAGESGLTDDCVAKADDLSLLRICDIRINEGPLGEVVDRMPEIERAIAHCLGLKISISTPGEPGSSTIAP